MAGETAVVQMVNLMFAQAVRDGASDIHIEPYERDVKVRYRIDGMLHDMLRPPKRMQPALVSRIKILGEMNMVAEGIRTSKSVYDLSRKLGVETPICEQVYLALYEDLPVVNAIQNLLTRTPKQEMVFHND